MEVKSDDDMGFEKVYDEMGCNSEEDREYVKVERSDVYVSDNDKSADDKSDADVVDEESVDDYMEYEENERHPFPKTIQGLDLQEVDLSYTQYSPNPDPEDDSESSDGDFGYDNYMLAYVESKQNKVKRVIEVIDDEKRVQYEIIPPYPFLERRQKMNLREIVKENVLPFLPAKSLVRFRTVSKEWDQWIRSPLLVHQHSFCCNDFSGYFCQQDDMVRPEFVSLDAAAYGVPCPSLRFLPEHVLLISSSHGLLLCHGCDLLDHYYVVNPATQDWARIPSPQLYHGEEPSAVLAFEPSAVNCGGHYQILCAVKHFDRILFELYSSATGSWKESDTQLVEMGNTVIVGSGFYMKGVAYMKTSKQEIIAFHLATELHGIIPLPSAAPDGVLTQVKGELCYIGLSHVSMNKYSLFIYAGFGLGFKREVEVEIGPRPMGAPQYRILPCPDERRLMILVGNGVYQCILDDEKVQDVTRIAVTDHYPQAKRYLPYVNSLVQVAEA